MLKHSVSVDGQVERRSGGVALGLCGARERVGLQDGYMTCCVVWFGDHSVNIKTRD